MYVRKFLARTLPEALAQVKVELGADAVILHTSTVKVGGIFGLFGTKMIEVTAAAEHAELRPAAASMQREPEPVRELVGVAAPRVAPAALPHRAVSEVAPALETAPAGIPTEQSPAALQAVQHEMESMKAMLGHMMDKLGGSGSGPLEPELKEICRRLTDAGVADEVAAGLVRRIRERMPEGPVRFSEALAAARELIRQDLGEVQTVRFGGHCRVVALVGPTGVGKTTTLAKLAAHFALIHRLNVAMITADTYRVAAVEQLRTYAEILGTPLEIVYEPEELHLAVAKHRKRDLILVDTAGRSPRNEVHMRELNELLHELAPDETHLVISMTSNFRDALFIVDNYQPIGFDRYIFTKWDEVGGPGLIYSLVQKHGRPLSYITTGQNVPDDFEIASTAKITQALLGD